VELDWTTFALEIVNFLILVWILQRFLYRPVLDVIARRRERVEQTLADASKRDEEAKAKEAHYEERVAQWENERDEAREKLAEEIAAERARRMEQLEQTLADEREKEKARARQRADEERRARQEEALAEAAQFASRLLQRLAGPQLDARIVDALVEDLGQLPDATRRSLAEAAAQPGVQLQIVSARPLEKEARKRIAEAFEAVLGRRLDEEAGESPDLIAGLLVAVGPWVLAANLRDELAFFRGGAQRAD